MVTEREDVLGLDASIMMHPRVWEASGHLAGFSDPLVDCRNCKERFRADKAPKAEAGSEVIFKKGGRSDGEKVKGIVGAGGYVCPNCGGSDLSDERRFNLMFRSAMGPVDTVEALVDAVHGKEGLNRLQLREALEAVVKETAVYLRPETAQAMFVQYQNVMQSMSPKIPFGIAQSGKSFRNEIITEKFIFRTCEFEQMEMEYFVEPGTHEESLKYWCDQRLSWWKSYLNDKNKIKLRQHDEDELAHYSSDCYDVEYEYPWGWDELEGIASRTDYDLKKHAEYSGEKLVYFDQQKNDPETGKPGWRYVPYVIEPAAGLTRAVLVYLCDAYCEEKGTDADGAEKTRVVLKLHPKFAPYKVAVMPLMKKEGMPELAREVAKDFFKAGISAKYDEVSSIGKRYAKHDEIGTPYCITVDHQSLEDRTVTIRDRDTTQQQRIKIEEALALVKQRLLA